MSDAKSLLQHKRIALDSNIFIYALEDNTHFPSAKRIFTELSNFNCLLITSTITIIEITIPLFRSANNSVLLRQYLDFLDGNSQIKLVPVNKSISLKAAQLRAQYNLKTPDAIQLATALLRQAEVFITADRHYGFSRIGGMKIELLKAK